MIKVVLFTHDDLDAAGCAIVFTLIMKATNGNYEVIYCSNNNIDKKVQEAWDSGVIDDDTIICFGDICPSEEMAKKLVANFKEPIRVWDHHATNSYISNVIPGASIVTEIKPGRLESGTSLMYLFFTRIRSWNNENYLMELLNSLVENVRSYDTYEWKKTNNLTAQRLNALFKILGMKRFVKRYVDRILDRYCSHAGSVIEARDDEYIDAYLEKEQSYINSLTIDDVKTIEIKGLKAAVRFSGGAGISEVANQFLTKYPEYDVFIDLGISGGYYSFRTIRNDLDVGAMLAKPLGGGGHSKAAGAPISEELKDEIINLLIGKLK